MNPRGLRRAERGTGSYPLDIMLHRIISFVGKKKMKEKKMRIKNKWKNKKSFCDCIYMYIFS